MVASRLAGCNLLLKIRGYFGFILLGILRSQAWERKDVLFYPRGRTDQNSRENRRKIMNKKIVVGTLVVLVALSVLGCRLGPISVFEPEPTPVVVIKEVEKIVEVEVVREVVVEATPEAESGASGSYVVSDGVCRLDKIATWSESAGGPFRIEAGGGGVEHIDFYPDRGVKAVSYIVPVREPEIWWGFGSAWEGNGPECQSFDYVADAKSYATGRLNNGHSGIVVDLRSGSAVVVANVANLSDEQIDELLAVHQQAMNVSSASASVPATSTPSVSTPPTPAPVVCPEGVREDHSPVVGSTWSPAGECRVVNFWTNEPEHDQVERKLLLGPEDHPALRGGGSSWSWPANCGDVAQREYAKNPLSSVTLAQLADEGLVK